MSEALLAAGCCDNEEPCLPAPGTQGPPGPEGPQGPAGPAGVDGQNAWDTLAAGFTMPAEGANVTIELTQGTAWLVPDEGAVTGHILVIQFAGYVEVVSITDATHAVIKNLANTGSGLYSGNAAPGTSIPILSRVCSGGAQGPQGIVPGGALLSANNLNDVTSTSASRTNLGLGTAAVKTAGAANGNLPPVDTTFTNGDPVFATATGVQTKAATAARPALGLGTMAVQNANAIAVTGGAIDGTTIGATVTADAKVNGFTAGTIQTGDLIIFTKLFTSTTTIQSLLAPTTISPNAAKIRVVGNGGAVLLTATPTITNPLTDGQHLFIQGTSDANTVTLQDEASLPGSKLKLAASTRALGLHDVLHLMFDLTDGVWVEISFSDNN